MNDIQLNLVKTVDELVEINLDEPTDEPDVDFTIDYIIAQLDDILLSTLKLETNKPSKYDLYIIQLCNTIIDQKIKFNLSYHENLNAILNVYKNRKV